LFTIPIAPQNVGVGHDTLIIDPLGLITVRSDHVDPFHVAAAPPEIPESWSTIAQNVVVGQEIEIGTPSGSILTGTDQLSTVP
jgi:hypothetical protein